MKSTDSIDFVVMGLFFAVFGLVLGEPLSEAFGSAIRFVGTCTIMRGALDALDGRLR